MEVVSRLDEIRDRTLDIKCKKNTIGFLPTMGALHEGHLALLRRSVRENDVTVCSIFVNPIQFNNTDDLVKYPRNLERDLDMLQQEGCDVVFTPNAEEFYEEKPRIRFDFGELETEMEGAFRPGHFNGVAIVVSRLLNLVNADKAYFGLKDLQQYYVVRRMCIDLAIAVEIIPNDIIREPDGLAMSSRNQRLLPEDREKASLIYRILQKVRDGLIQGLSFSATKKEVLQSMVVPDNMQMEYLKLVSLPDFKTTDTLNAKGQFAICIAAMLGNVRLIDNLIFEL